MKFWSFLRAFSRRRPAAELSLTFAAAAEAGALSTPQVLDFDPATLRWRDRSAADVEGYIAALPTAERAAFGDALRSWRDLGYAVFPQAIDHALIDAYLADIEELYDRRGRGALILGERFGIRPARELTREFRRGERF
ncbi:MAG: hypothetical protein NZ585_09370 [Chloracidobacterium sp.]|nr:hypothetical protein [Chloracidobacterium sp.]MDW8217011.1 hypothetical protein [Acidobacteriota bacterium]